ncbi:MAG TPA: beta-ketoacyl synthase chain length factor [Oleiagrimonas sp.]|nr:beta-ketoacyl synthase chain length factor [Oleiagrimonas sp.]
MSAPLTIWVQGVGAWMPGLADWPAWRGLLRGEREPDADAPARPKPTRLSAGESRRVSTHVLAAIEVADQAVTMSAHAPDTLPCVFASQQGDAGIMDYMCAVLADAPQHLSPTRFHNSVHNAPAGYWTIACGCRAASNSVAAAGSSFGAALLEAATLALTEEQPVLLVANDEPCGGPLGEVLTITQPFACALVLSPQKDDRSMARLDLALVDSMTALDPPRHPHAQALIQANPCAPALPLLEALAGIATTDVTLAATPTLGLAIHVSMLA